MNVAILEDETRVIRQSEVFKAFGRIIGGRGKDDVRAINRPAFLDARNLQPFINKDLDKLLQPIVYRNKRGTEVKGYNAKILPKICDVYLSA